jgi:hypothetical protein
MAPVGRAEATVELVKTVEKLLIVARSLRGMPFVHALLYLAASKPLAGSYKIVI